MLAAAFVLGCGSGDRTPAAGTVPPKSPEEKLYEGARSASFQLDSAIELIEATAIQARLLAKNHPDPGAKQDYIDLAADLDGAAMKIRPHTDDPPPLYEFTKEPGKRDAKRLEAALAGESCAKVLSAARAAVADILKGDPGVEEKKALENMAALLKDSELAVTDSVKALRG